MNASPITVSISILNQRTRDWRSTDVDTMADAVRLTHGLLTHWLIRWTDRGFEQRYGTAQPLDGDTRATWHTQNAKQRYQHSLRSLICRWISTLARQYLLTADDRAELRLILRQNDISLFQTTERIPLIDHTKNVANGGYSMIATLRLGKGVKTSENSTL